VIATSRNPSKTPDLVKTLQSTGRAHWLALDVTASVSVIKETMNKAEGLFNGIDILVNCAGYSVLGAMEDIDEDDARKQWETNYWGPMRIIKSALPAMRARKSGQ
jgi:NAD(P)-dependent dehydrogenase (short-subunit alcohol dehydrogenase family)